jgi:hypothetical protein
VNVTLFVEGGGNDNQALQTECRRGFRTLLERATLKGRMSKIVACGSRGEAYDSFCTALAAAGPNDFPMLLVDSEAPVTQQPWDHLKAHDGWAKPAGATDDHVHLMVPCMENWLRSDPAALAQYYGQGFKPKKLPANPQPESVGKTALYAALKAATRDTKTKGEYDKGGHSFELLARIDPAKLDKFPHADLWLKTLKKKC